MLNRDVQFNILYRVVKVNIFHNELFTSTFSGQQFIPSFYQVVKVYNLQVYISYRVVDVANPYVHECWWGLYGIPIDWDGHAMPDPSLLTTLIWEGR